MWRIWNGESWEDGFSAQDLDGTGQDLDVRTLATAVSLTRACAVGDAFRLAVMSAVGGRKSNLARLQAKEQLEGPRLVERWRRLGQRCMVVFASTLKRAYVDQAAKAYRTAVSLPCGGMKHEIRLHLEAAHALEQAGDFFGALDQLKLIIEEHPT